MESFLVSFTPISAITIFTALYKRVETNEWTKDKEIELKNFREMLKTAIKRVKDAKDDKRLEKLQSFKKNKYLELRDVETSWVVDVIKNFDNLKNNVHQFALSTSGDEKDIWEEIENKLDGITVAGLGYDHSLCSGILDDSLKLLKNISDKSRQTFKIPNKKFKLPTNIALRNICENFIRKEQEKRLKSPQVYKDVSFSKFLDKPEKLHELTNQILKVLTSAERKESGKWAKHSDYMVIAQIGAKEVEIEYLEMDLAKIQLMTLSRQETKGNLKIWH
ncbi:8899_t:CDS:2 [Racocetra fulgida]|uniref:8899_t:CDS:1 n=1 Tax=Racocetra fulgida TaxID=60492 RepID=A0A9N8ZHY7_9GLOM|nr:8899_t:CDS:2 [Racocetra fulgida]